MSWYKEKSSRYMMGGLMLCILLLGVSLFLSSCGPKEVFLQTEEIKLMDSLFVSARQQWNHQLSDTCAKLYEIHFDKIVDSLKEDRLMEIREILNKHE